MIYYHAMGKRERERGERERRMKMSWDVKMATDYGLRWLNQKSQNTVAVRFMNESDLMRVCTRFTFGGRSAPFPFDFPLPPPSSIQ